MRASSAPSLAAPLGWGMRPPATEGVHAVCDARSGEGAGGHDRRKGGGGGGSAPAHHHPLPHPRQRLPPRCSPLSEPPFLFLVKVFARFTFRFLRKLQSHDIFFPITCMCARLEWAARMDSAGLLAKPSLASTRLLAGDGCLSVAFTATERPGAGTFYEVVRCWPLAASWQPITHSLRRR